MTEQETQPWLWDPDRCPADQDFIAWVQRFQPSYGHNILHMGPGYHHNVGLKLSTANSVVSLTISPGEVTRYIELCNQDQYLSYGYTCIYGDIGRFNFQPYKPFDMVTLFHLCEIDYSETYSLRLLAYLFHILKRQGYLLGYRHSVNAQQAIPLIERYFDKKDEFHSLDIYHAK